MLGVSRSASHRADPVSADLAPSACSSAARSSRNRRSNSSITSGAAAQAEATTQLSTAAQASRTASCPTLRRPSSTNTSAEMAACRAAIDVKRRAFGKSNDSGGAGVWQVPAAPGTRASTARMSSPNPAPLLVLRSCNTSLISSRRVAWTLCISLTTMRVVSTCFSIRFISRGAFDITTSQIPSQSSSMCISPTPSTSSALNTRIGSLMRRISAKRTWSSSVACMTSSLETIPEPSASIRRMI
mmetsp:Transcript_97384/g.244133  ORF Transcript_97384/g.244133 Transcript_97384/m.244133 type:complete len:243 (-) Transcript_97384:170-898(-)